MNKKKKNALLQSKNLTAADLYDMDTVKYRQTRYSLHEHNIVSAKMLRLRINLVSRLWRK